MNLEQAPVEDGIKYVTREAYEDYILNPVKEKLQLKSGMTQGEIDQQRKEMLAGRREVTWRNFILKVRGV